MLVTCTTSSGIIGGGGGGGGAMQIVNERELRANNIEVARTLENSNAPVFRAVARAVLAPPVQRITTHTSPPRLPDRIALPSISSFSRQQLQAHDCALLRGMSSPVCNSLRNVFLRPTSSEEEKDKLLAAYDVCFGGTSTRNIMVHWRLLQAGVSLPYAVWSSCTVVALEVDEAKLQQVPCTLDGNGFPISNMVQLRLDKANVFVVLLKKAEGGIIPVKVVWGAGVPPQLANELASMARELDQRHPLYSPCGQSAREDCGGRGKMKMFGFRFPDNNAHFVGR